MRTVIVHILSVEPEKIENAFDIVREALTAKEIDVMLFESETLREASEILRDQADKREPKVEKKEVPTTEAKPVSAFGHLYDDSMYT